MSASSYVPDLSPSIVLPRPRPLVLVVIGLAGLAAASASVALALLNDNDRSTIEVVLTTWITLPYVVSGLVAWRRRPTNRFGPLLVAAGFVYALSTLQWATVPVVHTFGHLFDLLPAAVFLHVYLAYPTGRLAGRFERVVVAVGYAAALGLQLVGLLLGGFDPLDVFTVWEHAALGESLHNAELLTLSAACFAGLVVLASRRVEGGRVSLRPAALLIDTFALGLVAIGVLLLAGAYHWDVFAELRLFAFAAIGLAPIAFLLGVLDARLARSGAGDLMVQLRANPSMDLREPLARALRDPSVQVAYWLAPYDSWADADGAAVTLPTTNEDRAVTFIDLDGAPVAALVHDPSLRDQPELLESVSAAAGFALENARLQVELKARLQELQGSRSRVIEAGQAERKRLERNLHDGAQQRLVALSLELTMLESRLGDDPEARARLDRARDEVAQSLEELRDLARGIHPAVLSSHGLGVALQSLVARSSVPVRLSVQMDGRLPESVEVAAYYVVSECLANVAKHASASDVTVSVVRDRDRLRVEVADDGVGGADTEAGSGLRGLADRVEALDGRLRVWSPVGHGTRLQADIPCTAAP